MAAMIGAVQRAQYYGNLLANVNNNDEVGEVEPEHGIRDYNNPFEQLNDRAFKLRYRLNKDTVLYLCNMLSGDLQRQTARSKAIPVHLQVLTALDFYANDTKDRKNLGEVTSGKKLPKKPSKKKKSKTPKSIKPAYCTQVPYAVALIHNEIVMFKKGKMWRFSSTGRLLSDVNGEYVQSNYRGVPNGFKAVYQRKNDDKIVFLKGADLYIFNGNTLESGPTKLKSIGLKGNPSAVFYHRGERKSYYFKGSSVWRFDDRRQIVDPGFPKPISDVFQGLPPKITGAFQDVNGDLIFVQGKGYYRIRLGNTLVTGGRKLFHREIIKGC